MSGSSGPQPLHTGLWCLLDICPVPLLRRALWPSARHPSWPRDLAERGRRPEMETPPALAVITPLTSARPPSNAWHRPNDSVQNWFHTRFHAYSCASAANEKAAAHLNFELSNHIVLSGDLDQFLVALLPGAPTKCPALCWQWNVAFTRWRRRAQTSVPLGHIRSWIYSSAHLVGALQWKQLVRSRGHSCGRGKKGNPFVFAWPQWTARPRSGGRPLCSGERCSLRGTGKSISCLVNRWLDAPQGKQSSAVCHCCSTEVIYIYMYV